MFCFEEIEDGKGTGYVIVCKEGNVALDVMNRSYLKRTRILFIHMMERKSKQSEETKQTRGNVFAVDYKNQMYFYQMNLQGDIIGIVDNNGKPVVTYTYDSGEKLLAMTDESGVDLAKKNPFRYRAYCMYTVITIRCYAKMMKANFGIL